MDCPFSSNRQQQYYTELNHALDELNMAIRDNNEQLKFEIMDRIADIRISLIVTGYFQKGDYYARI